MFLVVVFLVVLGTVNGEKIVYSEEGGKFVIFPKGVVSGEAFDKDGNSHGVFNWPGGKESDCSVHSDCATSFYGKCCRDGMAIRKELVNNPFFAPLYKKEGRFCNEDGPGCPSDCSDSDGKDHSVKGTTSFFVETDSGSKKVSPAHVDFCAHFVGGKFTDLKGNTLLPIDAYIDAKKAYSNGDGSAYSTMLQTKIPEGNSIIEGNCDGKFINLVGTVLPEGKKCVDGIVIDKADEDNEDTCKDTKDNDKDGLIDCDDQDCWQQTDGKPWCCCPGKPTDSRLTCNKGFQCTGYSFSGGNLLCKDGPRGVATTIGSTEDLNPCVESENECEEEDDEEGNCLKCVLDKTSGPKKGTLRWFIDLEDPKDCHVCDRDIKVFQFGKRVVKQIPISTHTISTASQGTVDCYVDGTPGFCNCGECSETKPCRKRKFRKDYCPSDCEGSIRIDYTCTDKICGNPVRTDCSTLKKPKLCLYSKGGGFGTFKEDAKCGGKVKAIVEKIKVYSGLTKYQNIKDVDNLIIRVGVKQSINVLTGGIPVFAGIKVTRTILFDREDIQKSLAALRLSMDKLITSQQIDYMSVTAKYKIAFVENGVKKYFGDTMMMEKGKPVKEGVLPSKDRRGVC